MDEATKILYREIQERYVKVVWTHKIQLCQVNIHIKNSKQRNEILTGLSVLVSAAAITNFFKWLPEDVILPLLAALSLILTFFTLKYKTDNLGKLASENDRFAAIMHHLRNRYASLLSDIKANKLSYEQIVRRRDELEKEENLIYSGMVPATTSKAVADASKALKVDQESTTTDAEISLIVSKNLQL